MTKKEESFKFHSKEAELATLIMNFMISEQMPIGALTLVTERAEEFFTHEAVIRKADV